MVPMMSMANSAVIARHSDYCNHRHHAHAKHRNPCTHKSTSCIGTLTQAQALRKGASGFFSAEHSQPVNIVFSENPREAVLSADALGAQ